MTTNPRSLAVRYDEDGKVTWLICEQCTEWTSFADLYRDGSGDVWDICQWCGRGEQRPHLMIEVNGARVMMASVIPAEQALWPEARIEAVRPQSIEEYLAADGKTYSGWNPHGADQLDDMYVGRMMEVIGHVEVWLTGVTDGKPRFDWVTFDPAQPLGQVPCHECGGTDWWGFGPAEAHGPCVYCKGTGREWVGLW